MANISGVQPGSGAAAAMVRPEVNKNKSPHVETIQKPVGKVKEPSQADLQQAVDQANRVLESKTSNELHFAIEKGTGISVVKLISRQSGETLMQFPSEAMIGIAKSIDQVTGAIIRQHA